MLRGGRLGVVGARGLGVMSRYSTSSDDEPATWVPYSRREDWKDVKPVPLDDDGDVVAIQYSQRFAECHAYFRAVVAAGELSLRVVKLTEDVINSNPANYSAWKYRRDALVHTKSDLRAELDRVADLLDMWPKNYQIWHHRRELLEVLGDATGEKPVIDRVLSSDAKNIHAWGHRRWTVTHFGLWEGEFDAVHKLIASDVHNNSAWSYRYFLVDSSKLGLNPEVRQDVAPHDPIQVRKAEIEYTLQQLATAPGNEAAHNYLLGQLLPLRHKSKELLLAAGPQAVVVLNGLLQACKEHADEQGLRGAVVWSGASLADIYVAADQLGVSPQDLTGSELSFRDEARQLWGMLEQLDPIRRVHWRSLAAQLSRDSAAVVSGAAAAGAQSADAAVQSNPPFDGATAQSWRTPGAIPATLQPSAASS
eukprot:Hpha_TRINITY_DN10891_c0_g1::TRINITY_DN10891_c0_g1_i1::g.23143::m.23143/K05955/FNTA; protein farnesyltransferase/geranylgeranyltransferase type-1 subunit alpha